MVCLQDRRVQRWYVVVALASVLAALVQPAQAADVDQLAGSLKWIPADAAYYGVKDGDRLHLRVKSDCAAVLEDLLVRLAPAST